MTFLPPSSLSPSSPPFGGELERAATLITPPDFIPRIRNREDILSVDRLLDRELSRKIETRKRP